MNKTQITCKNFYFTHPANWVKSLALCIGNVFDCNVKMLPDEKVTIKNTVYTPNKIVFIGTLSNTQAAEKLFYKLQDKIGHAFELHQNGIYC